MAFPQFATQTETETAAFGYRASRVLMLEQRVRTIRDMRRSLTAGDGLANQIIGENFVPDLINGCSVIFGEPEIRSFHADGNF